MVQSSSAAMAITITCALNGWLGDIDADPMSVFRNSAAIVLGKDIGTTVTAWLVSLGANANLAKSEIAFATAIFHTSSNFVNICILVWSFYKSPALCSGG
jgi:Na+/phosphate symporter